MKNNYYYNPYLLFDREGKGEMMSFVRAMFLFCITILLSVCAIIFNNYMQNRFEIVSLKDGIFIFDRQTTSSNYCNDNKCVIVSDQFLSPPKDLISRIPGINNSSTIQPSIAPSNLPMHQKSAHPNNHSVQGIAPASPNNFNNQQQNEQQDEGNSQGYDDSQN